MKIELKTVKVRDLIANYKDSQEKGVTAWAFAAAQRHQ